MNNKDGAVQHQEAPQPGANLPPPPRAVPPPPAAPPPVTSEQFQQSRNIFNNLMIRRGNAASGGGGDRGNHQHADNICNSSTTTTTHNQQQQQQNQRNSIANHHRHFLQSITSNTNSQQNKSNHSGGSGHSGHTANQSNTIGNYELIKTLGRGNFATVKLAKHRLTHHSVAIKIVKLSNLNEDNLMKVNREIEIMKKLGRHKHILRLYQVIKTKRYYFLVTDHCANGELYDYIIDKGRLNEYQACKYFTQILSAIEYLHDHNVVHRDLKAENLLLTDNYETIKIADFGFANYFKQNDLLATWCGSPPYAAPELFKGVRYVGPQVDIWSSGVVLFVLVCASLPFDGHNLVFLKSRVLSGKFRVPYYMSDECEHLIRGMLRLDPEKRYSIKQIKAHAWMRKFGNSTISDTKEEPKATEKAEAKPDDNNNENTDEKTATAPISVMPNASSAMELDKDKSTTSRGQSLDLEDGKKAKAEIQNEDASMLSLTSCVDQPKTKRLSQITSSRMNPKDIRNLVDTDIVNAVSNMSIDSNNSSMSHGIDANMAIAGSGQNSSISSSQQSNSKADSGCGTNIRQFSKESSIDDQIIDFMVENLKVADHQNSVRQSIANEKYDDLHAIYRLLRDQPDMLLESKFKIPSLPLISPSKDSGAKKPSITTGFFNFAQVNTTKKPPPTRTETFNFSNDNKTTVPPHRKTSDGDANIMNLTKQNFKNESRDPSSVATRSRGSEDLSWNMPPQLFLTPPVEGRSQPRGDDLNATDQANQEGAAYPRHNVARHSFDSTIKNTHSNDKNSTAFNQGLDQTSWDSSSLDPQSSTMTPGTPVRLGDSSISASFSDTHNTTPGDPLQIARNLATITTNLPQIGIQTGINMVNHNLLLAQLNSGGGNAVMTQSGLLTQNESNEQRLQQTIPLKFTPNNLANQNFNLLNNLALQNTLKIPGMQNLSLLDPDGLLSGLERRASDGQASYSSLTNTNNERVMVDPRTGGNIIQSSMVDGTSSTNEGSRSSNQLSSQNQSLFRRDNSSVMAPTQFANQIGGGHFRCSDGGGILAPAGTEQNQGTSFSTNRSSIGHADNSGPLDLSNKSPQSNTPFKLFGQEYKEISPKANNQRSNSTTSETTGYFPTLYPSSATTSPRSSIFAPHTSLGQSPSSVPFSRALPSSSSLSGGGPGHLLNRRKRHSLETESRHLHGHQHHHNHHHMLHYNQQQQQQQQQQHSVYQPQYSYQNFSANNQLRHVNKILTGDTNRSPRHTSYFSNYQANQFGPMRNFSQTPMKQTTSSSSSGWGTPKSPANSTTVDMDTSESQDTGMSSDEKFFG